MIIGEIITSRFSEISTIALHIYFLYRTLDTKVGVKKQVLAGTIFICVRIVYYILAFDNRSYFSVLAGIIYAYFVFAGNFQTYIVWMLIPVVLDGIVETAIINFYLFTPNAIAEQIDSFGIVRILLIVVARITLFLVYYIVTKKIDKSHPISWQDFFPLSTVPIGCWVLLEVVFRLGDTLVDRMSTLLLATGSLFLLLIMTSIIALYNRLTASGRELTQSKLQLRTVEMTQDHISQINDMYGKLSGIRHDLHNHFTAMSGYLYTKDYPALEKYIVNLSDFDMNMQVYVKHPVLNALISSRVKAAQNTNIDFFANIVLPEDIQIPDVDLCILISNILDNAFEANEKAVEPRYINLCTSVVNSYWVVVCRNTTHEKGHLRTTGSMKSTKDDKGVHGIGTKQIQKIAEKYGGFVTYRHDNFEFTTLVTMKLTE